MITLPRLIPRPNNRKIHDTGNLSSTDDGKQMTARHQLRTQPCAQLSLPVLWPARRRQPSSWLLIPDISTTRPRVAGVVACYAPDSARLPTAGLGLCRLNHTRPNRAYNQR
ncbi:hypothetical protein CONLIGDRAFT_143177 [Coniochaeta ligniaria NRRL 30616]|uniref:Uncharacterized protein n=1 Tax=Coniochaeta ligniaria NRRL 30616 TaxID=1408157 RepID=A0A1J7I6K4_9PEZI|nr:hypothetical protein CONLIGDRAFT_143177 [Coniochaeta ligniaria NRRL 30616]